MPSEEEILAKRLLEYMKPGLTECTTEECRKARAEGEAQWKRIFDGHESKSLEKMDKIDQDLVKLLEGLEKQMNTPIELPPCPHCGYDSDEKPKTVGKCPDGCATFDEFDKNSGMRKCGVCGEDIEWYS